MPTTGTLLMHLPGQLVNETPELLWSVFVPTLLTFLSSIALNYGVYFFHVKAAGRQFGRVATACQYFFKVPGR